MVTLATLETDVYTAVYNLLQTGTYALSTDNIHPYVSDVIWTANQKDFPIIEIRVQTERTPRDRMGTPGATNTGQIIIKVLHNSSENMKLIADEVFEVFITEGALKVLSAAGIKVREIERELQEPEGYNPKRTMHSEVITINYFWRSS